MNPQQNRDHLSYSRISCYLTCPLKYRLSYLDRVEPEFTPSALHFGHAIHSGIQAYWQSVLEADPLKPDQLVDIYRQEWTGFDGPPIRFSGRESEESLLTTATQLFSLFVNRHDPDTEVIAVEEKFNVDLAELIDDYPGELPLFTGYIDAILKLNDSHALVDYKTSSRKPNGDMNSTQLVAYSIGSRVLGYEPDGLEYRFEFLVKTVKADLVRLPVKIGENDRRRFLKLITRVWKAIQTFIFYPNPGYLCASCAYQGYCREW